VNLPIRVRLTLWFAGLLAAIVTCLGVFLVLQLESELRTALDEEIQTSSVNVLRAFTHEVREHGPQTSARSSEESEDLADAARASLPPSAGAQVLDAEGRVLAHHGAVAGGSPLVTERELRTALAGLAPMSSVARGDEDQQYRTQARTFTDRGQPRVLVIALSMRPVEEPANEVLLLLLIAGPVGLAAASAAAYWLAHKALRPVERMTSDAQEIGKGGLNERVAIPATHDEIRRLGVTLNEMLDRIERGVMDRRRLVADASHALRTPLAVMRAEVDVSLRGDVLSPAAQEVLTSAREEVDRMSRTVDNLLAMAEADEGRLELLTMPISLRQAIDGAAGPLRMLASAKQVSLLAEGDPLEAQADLQRLNLALTNLIENAIKFTPPGSCVRVTTWRRGSEVGVTVSDEGPGIPAEDRAGLFNRYYRAESARGRNVGGSGLGLAICHEVALAHGGRLWLESAPGGGSAFFLALPGWRAVPAEDQRSAPVRETDGHVVPKA
jgi:heavy metal sensor kinase